MSIDFILMQHLFKILPWAVVDSLLFRYMQLILISINFSPSLFLGSPGGIPARNDKGERLLLFIGIIDILQSYRLKKKLEHTFKSIIHDGVSSFSAYHNFIYLQFIVTYKLFFFLSVGYRLRTSSILLCSTLSRFYGQDCISENSIA